MFRNIVMSLAVSAFVAALLTTMSVRQASAQGCGTWDFCGQPGGGHVVIGPGPGVKNVHGGMQRLCLWRMPPCLRF